MIIHFIHSPVSAKRFVEPLVQAAVDAGFNAELWLENRDELAGFTAEISCPKKFAKFDISFNPVTVVKNIINLAKRLKKVSPEAVHCHQSRASLVPLLSSRFAKVPVRIYHNHGIPYLGYKGPKRWAFWFLEFMNCLLATHVLAVTPTIRDEMMRSNLVSEEKIKCLGSGSVCGIDLDEFKIETFSDEFRNKTRKTLSIATEAFVVFYIGRPFARKGFDTLLQAWEIFCQLRPGKEKILLIAGCDLNDIVTVMDSCPAGVIPLGYLTELKGYYAACDIVTLPSLHEGMPYSLLEGAAAEKALVASDIPGIDSLVTHNENGLLVEPKNANAFAKAFDSLCENAELRNKLAGNARREVEKKYDRNICTKLLIDYYYDIGLKIEG